jgi:uncharacterized membrane protein YcaP (DUF421 family)
MFPGDEPPLFLLEIFLRTAIIYIYALVLLRWLGSRTIGQLSTIEFLLVIALGSAVGDAMFYPDVPFVHALLVITVVVLANKGLDVLIANSTQAERAIDGISEEAVRNGVICRPFMDGHTLSDSELFQQLRENGISQLGEIEGAYLEADGAWPFSKQKSLVPGFRSSLRGKSSHLRSSVPAKYRSRSRADNAALSAVRTHTLVPIAVTINGFEPRNNSFRLFPFAMSVN